jgi:hypothetical protein
MNLLVWQILVAAATVLMLFLRWQLCCRHHREAERRVVPVRREQRPPVPYVSRVHLHNRGRIVATRTIALSTLPMPIKGTIEEPVRRVRVEVAPSQPRPSDIRFAPPDVALMRRVIDGLRALPESPRDAPPGHPAAPS